MSDPDYSHRNEPNEDALEAMMDSAMALANTLGTPPPREAYRRTRPFRFQIDEQDVDLPASKAAGHIVMGTPHYFVTDPNGARREISEADYRAVVETMKAQDASGFPVAQQVYRKEAPPPPERAAIYAEAMAKALAEPPAMDEDTQAFIRECLSRIDWEVRDLRSVPHSNPVIDHALTSIELGLLGLAKVIRNGED
jgi:hypothetical protein